MLRDCACLPPGQAAGCREFEVPAGKKGFFLCNKKQPVHAGDSAAVLTGLPANHDLNAVNHPAHLYLKNIYITKGMADLT